MMKVWVLEQGVYSSRGVMGVYTKAETAMEEYPARPVPEDFEPSGGDESRPGGWQYEDHEWDNGLDWEESMTLREFEVK